MKLCVCVCVYVNACIKCWYVVRFEFFTAVRMMMFFWALSSGLKSPEDEKLCFSETLTSNDESTRRQNPEEHHYHYWYIDIVLHNSYYPFV
jgi:hypothetical protein